MNRFSVSLPLLMLAGTLEVTAQPRSRPGSPTTPADPEMPRPIDALETPFIEEMTWLEVRDAIRSGKTTAIVATGGVEANGPYVATGKHNYILRATTQAIARKLGDALIAPIVAFVPEGPIDPPGGAMRYPGTISLRNETFVALVSDIASSLRAHGFRRIILIGDSGGNQDGMRQVAADLSAQWTDGRTTILYVPEYYDYPGRQKWLESRGIHETDDGHHDEVSVEAIMMTVDPATVRMPQRLAKGLFSINGFHLAPAKKTIALGQALIDHIATVTVRAIRHRETKGQ